ncbi:MAG TPA: hypothetical protein VK465_08725 [Fibrobacteria bacterium]|nr:hypothetical protein [Fibrobacteria bacterium]
MRNLFLALLVLLPAAARAACTKITMPTDFAAVTSGTRANLKANFTEIETRVDNCIDSVDEVRARLSGYSTSLAITSLEGLRLRIDSDGSSASSVVFEGTSSDTLAAVGEDSTLYLPKLTASLPVFTTSGKRLTTNTMTGTGSVVMSTSPTITTPTFSGTVASGLTASRTVVTDGSGNLAVNTETGTGSHVRAASPSIASPTITGLTASRTLVTDGSGNMAVNTETGTGSHVRATSPTLVTPTLGVASATSIALGGNEAFTYDEGSFTATLTGVSGTVTGTATYVKIGKHVTLTLPALSGTSNASTCTITGLPVAIQAQAGDHIIRLMDNGTAYINSIYIENHSTMTLYSPSGGFGTGFTSSGTKGLTSNTNITYTLP